MTISRCISRCTYRARHPLVAVAFGLFQLLGASTSSATALLGDAAPGAPVARGARVAPVAPLSAEIPTFPTYQLAATSRQEFIVKADLLLAKQIPEWEKSRIAGRHEFVSLCMDRSARYGLLSERSVLAYTYASIWMGRQFEDASAPLLKVLNSGMHEERKSHAMLDWVNDQLDPKSTPGSGVSAIVGSLDLTKAWDER